LRTCATSACVHGQACPPSEIAHGAQDELGRTALHYCASNGYLNRFETVLDGAGDNALRTALVLAPDNQGHTVGVLALAHSPRTLEEITEIVKRKINAECAAQLAPRPE
jgi:thioredoxin reductase